LIRMASRELMFSAELALFVNTFCSNLNLVYYASDTDGIENKYTINIIISQIKSYLIVYYLVFLAACARVTIRTKCVFVSKICNIYIYICVVFVSDKTGCNCTNGIIAFLDHLHFFPDGDKKKRDKK